MAATFEYLAGIIDGDGCVSLHKKKDAKSRGRYSWSPYLSITSKDRWYLETLQKDFGGCIDQSGKSAFNSNKVHALRFSANEIRNLLPKILPHLIYKKEEAIKLLEAVTITGKLTYRTAPRSDEDRGILERIFIIMKDLKKERRTYRGGYI